MGYIKEPDGVTFVVEKQTLTAEMEERIKKFIEESKKKNKEFIEKLSTKSCLSN